MANTEDTGNSYQTERENKYPSWKDQLDLMYHKGFEEWRKSIKLIKMKYPKPPYTGNDEQSEE